MTPSPGVRSPAQTLCWYARRLSVMGPGELAARVGEQWSLRAMRVGLALRRASRGKRRADPARFGFCAATAPQLPALPWCFEPGPDAIEALLAGRSPALGYDWTWRPDGDVWHEAPDTGVRWPRTWFYAIPYRAGNSYGDVRVAWEPSRLQQLVALALLARASAPGIADRAAELLETQFLSWTEANPPFTGIHYISAMECGLRLLAVCHALDLVRDRLRAPERTWPALVALVEDHAGFIERRLSLHSSTGNHTIAECAALVYAGALFPELDGAHDWVSTGIRLLEREAPRQILADGGGLEQALWYHLFVVDLYGLVGALLAYRRLPLSPVLRYAATRGRDALRAFADAPERLPPLGDGDDGYALSPFLRLSWTGAAPAAAPLTTLTASGYSIIRSGETSDGVTVFDHGPLGMPPSYGHGHADALSVVLRRGDREVLIDPGTYTYTGDLRWRAYFRSTHAHNTVTVDGRDQARPETPFMWSRPFTADLVRSRQGSDGSVWLLARHDGYRGLGVEHWRGVVFLPPGCWLIWDWLDGRGRHRLDLHWHLGAAEIDRAGGAVRFSDPAGPIEVAIEGGDLSLHRGETEPILGWRSRVYGRREPVYTVRATFDGALPHEFVTVVRIGPGMLPDVHEAVSRLREWVKRSRRRQI